MAGIRVMRGNTKKGVNRFIKENSRRQVRIETEMRQKTFQFLMILDVPGTTATIPIPGCSRKRTATILIPPSQHLF